MVLGRAPGTEASNSHRARVRAAMPELAMLPALTGEELDVLGRALMDRLVIASAVVELDDDIDDGRRQYWAHEAAVAQSLATAVAEARYSLNLGTAPPDWSVDDVLGLLDDEEDCNECGGETVEGEGGAVVVWGAEQPLAMIARYCADCAPLHPRCNVVGR